MIVLVVTNDVGMLFQLVGGLDHRKRTLHEGSVAEMAERQPPSGETGV